MMSAGDRGVKKSTVREIVAPSVIGLVYISKSLHIDIGVLFIQEDRVWLRQQLDDR